MLGPWRWQPRPLQVWPTDQVSGCKFVFRQHGQQGLQHRVDTCAAPSLLFSDHLRSNVVCSFETAIWEGLFPGSLYPVPSYNRAGKSTSLSLSLCSRPGSPSTGATSRTTGQREQQGWPPLVSSQKCGCALSVLLRQCEFSVPGSAAPSGSEAEPRPRPSCRATHISASGTEVHRGHYRTGFFTSTHSPGDMEGSPVPFSSPSF